MKLSAKRLTLRHTVKYILYKAQKVPMGYIILSFA